MNKINCSFEQDTFPDKLKEACVVSLHKKKSKLEVGNYRPVSVLPTVSKLFERAMFDQLSDFFEHIFNPFFVCISAWLRMPVNTYQNSGRLEAAT